MIGTRKKPQPEAFDNPIGYNIAFPKYSDWGVRIAGKKSTFIIHPEEGAVPNFFHRWMQRLILGFYWSKTKK